MNASTSLEDVLAVVAKILLWCFALGMLLLMLWFAFFLAAGDLAYRFHAQMFDLSRQGFDMIHYCGMALLKVGSFMLFLIPWIAIRLTLPGIRKA